MTSSEGDWLLYSFGYEDDEFGLLALLLSSELGEEHDWGIE